MNQAVTGAWIHVTAPNGLALLGYQNECNLGTTLLRWRALGGDLISGWQDDGGDHHPLPASTHGWVVVDNCETPQWRLPPSADPNSLVNLVVAVQPWTAAP